jgi:hypothetical protein
MAKKLKSDSPLDASIYYPSSEGWWWIVGPDEYPVPVSVEKRGPRQVLSVCIPRCSTHCDKWWRPLKAIKGKWRGRVQLPLDNSELHEPETTNNP